MDDGDRGRIWSALAPAMAAWTDKHLVNRRDAFGRYIAVESRRDPDLNALTAKEALTLRILQKHFCGASTGDIIGLHSTASDEPAGPGEVTACWSRWGAWDIDRHDEKADPEVTRSAALGWYQKLAGLGFRPLLFDSNGNGGYHLMVVFDGPAPTAEVFRFLKWISADWASLGLKSAPETFPKQEAIAPGGYGNWLRLPGRHHTRDHWTKVWNGRDWLEGSAAVKAIVGTSGDSAKLIPPEALTRPKPVARPKSDKATRDLGRDARLAAEAMNYLNHLADNYDSWLRMGMSLTPLGPEGLAIWDRWSSQLPAKYEESACERKWRSFGRNGNGGLSLGTLFHEAKLNGYPGQSRAKAASKGRYAPKPGLKVHAAPPDAPASEAAEDPAAEEATFANYDLVEPEGGDKPVRRAIRMTELDARLECIAPGWPKRVGDDLFWESPSHEPVYFRSAPQLFAWIDGLAQVDWTKGAKLIPQERFYEHKRMTSEKFRAIETLPHWPPIEGIYYTRRPLPKACGKLGRLVDFFSPSTKVDRELILAMILTFFWGGEPGTRPAFLITGPDQEPEQGRGIGKSKMPQLLAQELAGGCVDVSPSDEIATVKTRLLSDGGIQKRVAMLDNIKTLRLSWGDLEGLITSPEISGHRMYAGNAERPNTLVWVLTVNGASLSKDMAQRVVCIKVDRPTYRPDWEAEVRSFARRHRWEILAEVGDMLASAPGPLIADGRWSPWQRDVLSKLGQPEECQKIITDRQGSIDDDSDERDLVADRFRDELHRCLHLNPEGVHAFIRSETAARWYNAVTNKRLATNQASSSIKSLSIPELRKGKSGGTLGWFWFGPNANPKATATKVVDDQDGHLARPDNSDSAY